MCVFVCSSAKETSMHHWHAVWIDWIEPILFTHFGCLLTERFEFVFCVLLRSNKWSYRLHIHVIIYDRKNACSINCAKYFLTFGTVFGHHLISNIKSIFWRKTNWETLNVSLLISILNSAQLSTFLLSSALFFSPSLITEHRQWMELMLSGFPALSSVLLLFFPLIYCKVTVASFSSWRINKVVALPGRVWAWRQDSRSTSSSQSKNR